MNPEIQTLEATIEAEVKAYNEMTSIFELNQKSKDIDAYMRRYQELTGRVYQIKTPVTWGDEAKLGYEIGDTLQ